MLIPAFAGMTVDEIAAACGLAMTFLIDSSTMLGMPRLRVSYAAAGKTAKKRCIFGRFLLIFV
ncbi:MAG: hypothetical protein ACYSUB_16805 [Planctomycetota bacterium]